VAITGDEDDTCLVAALRRRDEAAFVRVVARYQRRLFRLALIYAGTQAVADEIVQETWLAVIQGIDRFEGRASFKTWLFRILVNRARTRGEREGRMVPFSSLARARSRGRRRAGGVARSMPRRRVCSCTARGAACAARSRTTWTQVSQ